jgi:hypothetical protein
LKVVARFIPRTENCLNLLTVRVRFETERKFQQFYILVRNWNAFDFRHGEPFEVEEDSEMLSKFLICLCLANFPKIIETCFESENSSDDLDLAQELKDKKQSLMNEAIKHFDEKSRELAKRNAPGETRTHDLKIMRLTR